MSNPVRPDADPPHVTSRRADDGDHGAGRDGVIERAPGPIVRGLIRRLAVLANAQRVVSLPGFDATQIAVRAAEWALELAAADGAAIEVRDRDELVCRSATGTMLGRVGSRRPLRGSVAEACMARGVAATSAVVSVEGPTTSPVPSWTAVLPLLGVEGTAVEGVLTVTSSRAPAFDDHDIQGLEVIAGIAGGIMTKAAVLLVLQRTAARYRTLVEHLPGTAVMVFDQELCLLVVAGPGARLWRYAERDVAPGQFLRDIVTPAAFAILEPFYRSAFIEPGELEYHSPETGLDFHFSGVPIPDHDGQFDQLLITVTDVTQVKADEEALREAEERYRTAFQEGPVGMARASLHGHFESVNQAFCLLTGYTSEELCSTSLTAITHPDDVDPAVGAWDPRADDPTTAHQTEKRLVRADGVHVWVALSTTVVSDIRGQPAYLLTHFLDISERKRFESQLQHLADHDPLTGLLNRRSFEAALSRQVASTARHGHAGALLVLDLDHFKQINDTIGHHAGDELIVSMAACLRRRLHSTDVIGRLGGDEFAVMLPYATRERAERVAMDLLDAIRSEATQLTGTYRRRITTSIGLAFFDDPQRTGAEMLINADLAMYDAKEAGRDRYAVHETSDSQPTTRARLAWVDRITHALDDNRFTLYAQPILHLATRQITRHELLLRMIDDDGEIISPATFLNVAEKFGLIHRIDRWVVDHAIAALAAYADRTLSFEINLSGISMGDTSLLAFIDQRLGESPGVDPSQLTFEVTETATVANLGAARDFADHLTTLGCSFSLDDFGAGFGSFYYLKYLPFADLKIDGEFITHCLSNPTDQLVIDAVVTLAEGLGKRTIAEYVGDKDTLDYLATRGVDYAQGFHVGRPVPLEQAMSERTGLRHGQVPATGPQLLGT